MHTKNINYSALVIPTFLPHYIFNIKNIEEFSF